MAYEIGPKVLYVNIQLRHFGNSTLPMGSYRCREWDGFKFLFEDQKGAKEMSEMRILLMGLASQPLKNVYKIESTHRHMRVCVCVPYCLVSLATLPILLNGLKINQVIW